MHEGQYVYIWNIFRTIFPDIFSPGPFFIKVAQRFRETRSLIPLTHDRGPQRPDYVLQAEDQILNCVEKSPVISTRHLNREVGVSRTLREELPRIISDLLGNKSISLFELPWRLMEYAYYNFLKHDLLGSTEQIYGVMSLDVRANLWFLHDGGPPHFHVRVRQLIFDVEITSERHLCQRIFCTAQSISEDPIVLEEFMENRLRCAQMFVRANGGYFEHLLQLTFGTG
ncbi:hypothetical protein BDFB_011320 [Asbolus verrucosus]|uniref:Uncharacterized protein n=1 Tax=Asbolus verrucosus TaxID=1661398 RepID=A0A482VUV2_ASBVE|nr:hypothetical protein BDFB_011320 [Asbolus verrucosus]